jgi:hypothetical protein
MARLARRVSLGLRWPSWLTFLGHMKDSLWSIDLFRCESATLRSYWVLAVMDQYTQYTRRIIGFGIHAGTLNGVALCRMFNRAIRGQLWMPKYISSDNGPLYRFHQRQANLRILEATDIKSILYVPLSHPFVESPKELTEHLKFLPLMSCVFSGHDNDICIGLAGSDQMGHICSGRWRADVFVGRIRSIKH